MHGYKKPKNEWSKKKSKRNKFDGGYGDDDYNRKDIKKNKKYYQVRDGYDNSDDEYNK
jgi:hypothetical protein